MDEHSHIIRSIAGLEDRLRDAGVEDWLERQKVEVDGHVRFVIGGDRLADESEAMLNFAFERGLVTNEEVERASSSRPLPGDVEAVEIEVPEGDD